MSTTTSVTETDIDAGQGLRVRGAAARRIAETARDVFGWDPLRPGLARAAADVLEGHDVLGVMPTGYGKSAVYRLAGALLPGTTLIVSPLIALQADQLDSLAETPGARPAGAVNSSRSAGEIEQTWAALADGALGYLFVSPEQLANEEVLARLRAARIAVFVVDEAHCVSSWGHDFRPDYLRLGEVADALCTADGRRPPILALTATGSRPVREEIVQRLGMRDAHVLTHGFDRPNIHLAVVRHEEEERTIAAVLDDVVASPKPGLLYVATKRGTEVLAEHLRERGVDARHYHGGLGAKRRRALHEAFRDGAIEVVVATSAFGMGIDKADIRFVVHAAVTESLDEYYQELGRAGRDGEPARAVLHYRVEDLALRRFFGAARVKRHDLQRFHATALQHGDLAAIADSLGISVRRATALAALLADAGGLRLEHGRVVVQQADGAAAVRAALDAAASRQRIDESRLAMMRAYAETTGCRRQFLLGYFGDETAGPCGTCDACDAAATLPEQVARPGGQVPPPYPVDAEVQHVQWGDGRVMSVEEDRVTVFFDAEGYRVLSLAAVQQHGLLVLAGSPASAAYGRGMSDTSDGATAETDAEQADEVARATAQTTVTNDAVAGETVEPGPGDGNDGLTGGAPTELEPDLPDNELAGDDIDLRDAE